VSDDLVQSPEPIDPRKADAIHRALLTGLLSNVGFRNLETHEYTGARNTKFSIFPGSTLFKRRPSWVMSAELVETTKLYARTNAPVRPEWIEGAAAHLVHRTYAEPHWQKQTAHVVAYEKVTLYGMVLVPRRLVH
jgi:ATP-dependent helicase HrpA